MKPLVYVAGPYSSPDPVENTHQAIIAAERIESCGVDVVIPHLSLLWHLVVPAPYERWMERDDALLARCDAFVRIPGTSSGADRERIVAERRGMPLFEWPSDDERFRTWIASRVSPNDGSMP